eukprot:433073_1
MMFVDCFADAFITIYYASDGKHFVELVNAMNGLDNLIQFVLYDVSFVSKLRFEIKNSDVIVEGNYGGLLCTIHVNGRQYSTSLETAFWTIQYSAKGGNTVVKPTLSTLLTTIQSTTAYISDDAKIIWNFDCTLQMDPTYCINE